ncbi:MAG: DUF222 domain-containing protein [Acidimicrobiia bacterium]|nr:DUF222 domain-containing protein [Acidimicrobiia bacterium]
MTVLEIEACAKEMAAMAEPTPAVTAATRAIRRARAAQLDEVHAVISSGAFLRHGFRSPAAWLTDTTSESYGHCTTTVHLANRIQQMPLIRAAFATGDLAETAMRLLADTWCTDNADAFARDEQMLLGWATTLSARDLKMVLDTWRMHTDPDHEERTAQDRFDNRAVHISKLLDGVGRLDGTMDPEGYQLLHEAIRAYAQPAEGETRTAAQRRHDAIVQMAKIALDAFEPTPGKKRRRPKVIAIATATDLTDNTGGGSLDTGGDRSIVPIETIRRIACDCDLHRYLTEPSGHIIDYGRRRRLVSDTQFDLLIIRDHGCR